MRKERNGKRKLFTGILIVSVVVLLILLIGTRKYSAVDAEQQVSEAPSEKLTSLRKHEQEILTTYGIADENGYYRIPIARAKEILLQEASKNNPGD